MNNRKIRIIEYIKLLDSKELNRFTKLINASYFNNHKGTKDAFIYICKSVKKGEIVSREDIYHAVYENDSYESQKVSNILTYMMRLFEIFIKEDQQAHFDFSKLNILSFLADKELDSYFDREVASYNPENEHPLSSFYTNQFIAQYQLNRKKRTDSLSLQQSNSSLDIFYFTEKFKVGCKMLSHKNVLSSEFDFILFDGLAKQLEESSNLLDKSTLLKLYFLSYEMIKYDSVEIYQKIKPIVNSQEINIQEKKELYGYLQNFVIKQINKGNRDFLNELFDIYKEIIENGVVFSDGYLSEWKYKNIITAGCRLNKMEWTKQFIENYKEFLKPESKENAYRFNLASYYNFNGNHNETLNVLRDVEFSDIYYRLDTNVLLIKTYFALGEHELLLNLLDTFRILILRNSKVSTYQKKLYKNLIKYTKKLSLLESAKSITKDKDYKQRKKEINQIITTQRNTIAIDWLLEISG